MTWQEIGRDSFFAGQRLRSDERWRSCISRSYYAVFSVVVGRLEGRVRLRRHMLTPRHEELPVLVKRHMTELFPKDRRRLSTLLVRLRAARIRADYNRNQQPGKMDAIRACLDAGAAFRMLKVFDE